MVPTLCRTGTVQPPSEFPGLTNTPSFSGRCWGISSWPRLGHAADPPDAGQALPYAMNNRPSATSSCGHHGRKVQQNEKLSHLMEHSNAHMMTQLTALTCDSSD